MTFLVVALLLGATIGGLLGDIVGSFLPAGPVKTVLSKHQPIGFEKPIAVDFYAISFTFGFMLRINFMSVLFVLLVIAYFRWWYL